MTSDQNTYGTGYGCACADRDARVCASLRYGIYYMEECGDDERDERCECLCHELDDDLDDDAGAGA